MTNQSTGKETYHTEATVLPLFGRDEMNLVEFPIGPITAGSLKTYEVDHVVWDKASKREVTRQLIITGGDAFGLPRPTDDQVLIGMKALTQEAGYPSRKIFFSQYRLCQLIGWQPDGRAYRRLEASFDRLAATTLKFKNAWWDKAEKRWRSHTFHLIDNVELCSIDRYSKVASESRRKHQALCYFVWNEVVWKSFQDGYIKRIDMEMFRKVAKGRRREVPLRLYRWLDKQFYRKNVVRIDVMKLGVGTLGLAGRYPSELVRAVKKAASVLIECGFMDDVSFSSARATSSVEVSFCKKRIIKTASKRCHSGTSELQRCSSLQVKQVDSTQQWLTDKSEADLYASESKALGDKFGSQFERDRVLDQRNQGLPILTSGQLRQEYVRRFVDPDYREKVDQIRRELHAA